MYLCTLVSSIDLNKETADKIFFFTPAFHVFDNFSAHRIELWGQKFATAEHAFQWCKFSTDYPTLAEQIKDAKSPEAVKRLSNANKDKMPAAWHKEKVSVMEEILRAKVTQHEDVRELLLKTGNKEIIENSPEDDFWGIGPNGNGQNMVGKIYMKLRDELNSAKD